jgi:hypothetical protein
LSIGFRSPVVPEGNRLGDLRFPVEPSTEATALGSTEAIGPILPAVDSLKLIAAAIATRRAGRAGIARRRGAVNLVFIFARIF